MNYIKIPANVAKVLNLVAFKDKDIDIVVDQLSNSMELFDQKEFISFLSKNTKLKDFILKKIFNEYWKLSARDRGNPTFDFYEWVNKIIKK